MDTNSAQVNPVSDITVPPAQNPTPAAPVDPSTATDSVISSNYFNGGKAGGEASFHLPISRLNSAENSNTVPEVLKPQEIQPIIESTPSAVNSNTMVPELSKDQSDPIHHIVDERKSIIEKEVQAPGQNKYMGNVSSSADPITTLADIEEAEFIQGVIEENADS